MLIGRAVTSCSDIGMSHGGALYFGTLGRSTMPTYLTNIQRSPSTSTTKACNEGDEAKIVLDWKTGVSRLTEIIIT